MNGECGVRFEEGRYVVIVVVMALVMRMASPAAVSQELGITTSVPQNLSTSIRRGTVSTTMIHLFIEAATNNPYHSYTLT